ncbi:MAG: HEPN domain-containing protein [Desulfobacterales bacterium]|nr:HEPN domain-containing protein [Desulfobacterales bacterium]
MQDERNNLGSPNGWLKRAKSNLIRAKQPKHEEVFWEDLCFDAQQAVEKSLKALLLFHKIPFRFVHDIAELLTVLEQNGISLQEQIREAAELSDYAVEARYPGPMEPVSEDEYKEAVRIAETVVSWVENLIVAHTERTPDE